MAETTAHDTKLSLRAIAVGALTTFTIGFAFLLIGAGFATALFHIDDQNISGVGYAVSMIFLIFRTFVSSAAGSYVAGYFSPQRNITEARVHGFAAFALAFLLMAFYLGQPGSVGIRNFLNASTSYVVPVGDAGAVATPPPFVTAFPAPPPVPGRVYFGPLGFRRASAGTYLALGVLVFEGAVVALWAAGEAYRRRGRRGQGGISRDEARAA